MVGRIKVYFRTKTRWRAGKTLGLAALALAATAAAAPAWPPFLPPREALTPGVAAGVERVLAAPTLVREVEGRPAPVPRDVYLAFVDTPDVVAAAARYRGLARYDVSVLDDDWYAADDGDGARGVYRVLARTGSQRVILSWGTHTGAILGTISGSALTVLEFRAEGRETGQRLLAHVLIENRVAAALARVLARVFGGVVDRKLTEGFRVTAAVAEWAVTDPAGFCEWLARAPVPAGRREALRASFRPCAPTAVSGTVPEGA